MHGTLHQVGAMDPEIRWLQSDRCSHVSSDTMNGSIMTLQLRPATRRGTRGAFSDLVMTFCVNFPQIPALLVSLPRVGEREGLG